MEFFRFLRRESKGNFGRLLLMATLGGFFNALLVMVLVQAAFAADRGGASIRSFFLFILAFPAFVWCRRSTVKRTGLLVERALTKSRARLLEKIRRAKLLEFERVGRDPVYSALAQHTMTLSQAAPLLANLLSCGITVVFVAALIATVSMPAFFQMAGCLAVGVAIYRARRSSVEETQQQAMAEESRSFECMEHLLDGFKEVRMHAGRNEDLYRNYLQPSAAETERLKIKANDQGAFLTVLSQSYFYIVLAAIIFILPSYAGQVSGSVAQVAALILFMIGPLAEAVGSLPWLSRCAAAISKIEKLEETLSKAEGEEARVVRSAPPFVELSCESLVFRYGNENGDAFAVGPINFRIRAGEIVFIAGGNGNGKSTFLKVLTGLYPSQSGVIKWNGQPVSGGDLLEYRTLFSTVFSDSHLFDRLYGLDEPAPGRLEKMLEEMQLADKTRVEQGRFTTTNLSVGQRKRLGLVVAQLENRPIFVLDEVAAEQDPVFRKFFYEVLLRRWQQQGRALIVVTQDDQFFQKADRVLKMDYGSLEKINAQA